MYGKHFASMYEGSMVGAGAVTFAVWGYVIATSKPDRELGMIVDLNPKLLAFILGESEKDIRAAIHKLCSPDPESRTKTEDGRRLIKLGQFEYQVVNGAKYRNIMDTDRRREQVRGAMARYRARRKQKIESNPLPGEQEFVEAEKRGASEEELNEIAARHLPGVEEYQAEEERIEGESAHHHGQEGHQSA